MGFYLDLQFALLCNPLISFAMFINSDEFMDRMLRVRCCNDNSRRDEATLMYLQNWNPLTCVCQLLKAWLVGWTSNQLIVSLPVLRTPLRSCVQFKMKLTIKPITYLFPFFPLSFYPCICECSDFHIYRPIDDEISRIDANIDMDSISTIKTDEIEWWKRKGKEREMEREKKKKWRKGKGRGKK